MDDYVGQDLKKIIKSAIVTRGKSKEGTDYLYINLLFSNDYQKRVFLKSEEQYILKYALHEFTVEKDLNFEGING